MAFGGGDFGFVGESYVAPMTLQNNQESINYYLEHDPNETAKMPNALLGTPGLHLLAQTQVGPVRGMWVLPHQNQAVVVTGNAAYVMTITVPATSTTIPQFSMTQVGQLLTSIGPVCMRDNGVLQTLTGLGGYLVIVDGLYAYYYLLSGTPYQVTFTAATQGSNVLSLPFLPNGLVITAGGTLSAASGFIPAGTLITAVNTNLLTITMSNVALGSNATDSVTLHIPIFGQITDPGFQPSNKIAFIEGWLTFNAVASRTFFTTGPTPYQMLFPASFFALKDSSSDNLITMMEQNRELWLIGERTSEVWFNAGNANFPYERIPGVGPQIGCAAFNSIARAGQQLVWLARNEQGQNMVVITAQYSWERISTHAIEHAISGYPVIDDALAYAYEEEGHLFYVLTFPSADMTWVYDFTSKAWHRRAAWDSVLGIYYRHRSNCFMDFGDVRMVGDYQNGFISQMSRQYYTDNDSVLRALRRTPHVWNKESRERAFFNQLQIEFTPGVGLSMGQGSNPQAMLRWSSDGGLGNWTPEQWASIGKIGDTKDRAIWRLLGKARDRVWEVAVSDPVPRDIIGATLFAEG